MGCKCCNGHEQTSEMIDGNLPEENLNGQNNENEDAFQNNDLENKDNFYNFIQNTEESECITSDQKRNEEIFDYFNDLRKNPQNYLDEAEKYNLKDMILSVRDRLYSENINNLIKNPFFNLYLDCCVKKTPYSKEDILNNLENHGQLKIYKKSLYFVEAPIERPYESVWNLLTENKDKALDEILFKKIDYFIVSTIFIPDKKIIIAYFLFLKKSFNK